MRLTVMNFLEYAVWGAYLTSMGSYLVKIGMAENIGWFYSVQGIVSLFMPALIGIIADRWMQGQKVLSLCHFLAGVFMLGASLYGFEAGAEASFSTLFTLYSLSVAFFMPTIALANSVAYSALEGAGLDTVKDFPPIRVFGTVGFSCSMWAVELGGMQVNAGQFAFSGVLSMLLAAYALTLPACPVSHAAERKSVVEALGLRAFTLFRQKRMALFFIFSMCLGICLQITNGFASPFIFSFGGIPEYADTFGVFFALGNPGPGVWLFVLSMLVYGVAFDFFNVSGSLFVDKETDISIRSSAQGLFMMMTNGLGATIGTLSAQAVINRFVYALPETASGQEVIAGWNTCWYIFAAYALVVAVLFAIFFKYKHVVKD